MAINANNNTSSCTRNASLCSQAPSQLRSRKGVFLTLIAITIVVLLFTWTRLTSPQLDTEQATLAADRMRIITMNNYIETLDTHISSSVSVAGYLALENLSRQVQSGDVNMDTQLNTQAKLNAWIYNCIWIAPASCMNTSQSLNNSINNLTSLARSTININTSVSVSSIEIRDYQPFVVLLIINVSYNVSDASANNLAIWKTSRSVNTTIDVEGISDPLYMYEFRTGKFNSSSTGYSTPYRTFHRTNITRRQFDDTTFIKQFYTGREYIATYNSGISVVQRYTKDWYQNSSCCGITSVVLYSELNESANPRSVIANSSLVDYSYVNNFRYDCNKKETVGLVNLSTLAPLQTNARIDVLSLYTLFNYSRYTNPGAYFVTTCLS